MIPYDDLVTALASWRARQGLPVVVVPGAAPAARPVPPPAPRTAPRAAPLPADDFGADALVEAPYDPNGEDYVVSLAGGVIVESAESTAIGGPPERRSREDQDDGRERAALEPLTEGLLVPKRGSRKPDR
jgi:hypothetical protein